MPEARYRLFRRASGMYYQQDTTSGVQVSLRTKDKHTAQEKLRAANESLAQPHLNLDLARIYLRAHHSAISKRTWSEVMTAYSERGRDSSRERCRRAFAGRDFDPIRRLLLIDTKAEDLLRVLATGKASVNHYLRRVVHFAEDLKWLPWTVMARGAWPKVKKRPKRAITTEEHQRILEAEQNTLSGGVLPNALADACLQQRGGRVRVELVHAWRRAPVEIQVEATVDGKVLALPGIDDQRYAARRDAIV